MAHFQKVLIGILVIVSLILIVFPAIWYLNERSGLVQKANLESRKSKEYESMLDLYRQSNKDIMADVKKLKKRLKEKQEALELYQSLYKTQEKLFKKLNENREISTKRALLKARKVLLENALAQRQWQENYNRLLALSQSILSSLEKLRKKDLSPEKKKNLEKKTEVDMKELRTLVEKLSTNLRPKKKKKNQGEKPEKKKESPSKKEKTTPGN